MSKSKISHLVNSSNTISTSWLLVLVLTSSCFSTLSYGAEATNNYKLLNIGVIIDVDSHFGKEEKVAMELAAQSFNTTSQSYKLFLHFRNPGRDPLQTVSAAEKLIIEKEVAVIICMETWGQTALVAEIGNRAQVPIVSFAEPAITPPLTPTRWPFLVTMVNNRAEQIRCTAALVGSYNWRRVIVIYEDDSIGGDTGDLALLSEVLQNIGSEIEYRLVLAIIFSFV
ncbi:hypothetical protein Patl1_10593 [Pistacia atlantica]|uniref:Uncharacterized protein n=1 Tax=Pistacia atlantica TaxID=434234 RepID=A0ACC1A188_9ROSI|nr:hypothetical protein Patl1_10593 [Pistacia atlantica]